MSTTTITTATIAAALNESGIPAREWGARGGTIVRVYVNLDGLVVAGLTDRQVRDAEKSVGTGIFVRPARSGDGWVVDCDAPALFPRDGAYLAIANVVRALVSAGLPVEHAFS